ASNSLLEGMVLGAAASRSIKEAAPARLPTAGLEVPAGALAARAATDGRIRAAVRDLMWQHVGLVRNGRGLEHALAELERLEREAGAAERNRLLAARLIAAAALVRAES